MTKRIIPGAVACACVFATMAALSGCWPPEPKEDPLVPGTIDDTEAAPDAPAVAPAPDATPEEAATEPAPDGPADGDAPMSDAGETAAPGVTVVTAAEIADLRAKAAGKPMVVNLWATWCIPCREEMPAFAEFYEAYGDEEVIFLSLASDEPEAAEEYQKEEDLPFPVYVIGEGVELEDVSTALGVEIDGVLPTTVFFDFGSKKAEVHEGKLTFEQLEAKTKGAAAA